MLWRHHNICYTMYVPLLSTILKACLIDVINQGLILFLHYWACLDDSNDNINILISHLFYINLIFSFYCNILQKHELKIKVIFNMCNIIGYWPCMVKSSWTEVFGRKLPSLWGTSAKNLGPTMISPYMVSNCLIAYFDIVITWLYAF